MSDPIRKYADITVKREAKRSRHWRRGWDKTRMLAVAETAHEDREFEAGEDYRGALSDPDTFLNKSIYNQIDDMDRRGYWGVSL